MVEGRESAGGGNVDGEMGIEALGIGAIGTIGGIGSSLVAIADIFMMEALCEDNSCRKAGSISALGRSPY